MINPALTGYRGGPSGAAMAGIIGFACIICAIVIPEWISAGLGIGALKSSDWIQASGLDAGGATIALHVSPWTLCVSDNGTAFDCSPCECVCAGSGCVGHALCARDWIQYRHIARFASLPSPSSLLRCAV